jgi:hypothetical protein
MGETRSHAAFRPRAASMCGYAPDSYSSGEVDFFFILTAEGDSYLVPLAITKCASSLTLDCKYAAFKVA